MSVNANVVDVESSHTEASPGDVAEEHAVTTRVNSTKTDNARELQCLRIVIRRSRCTLPGLRCRVHVQHREGWSVVDLP